MLAHWKDSPSQFILTVIGRLFTAFPGVQRQLESGFIMVSHLILSNYIQAGGTDTCINCSPINTSLKRLISRKLREVALQVHRAFFRP